MRLFVFVVLAVIGSVSANCGCLKCSKHLRVAGEIPGAAGYGPIQVIFRGPGGPGGNGCFGPNALPISVQKPVDLSNVPINCVGGGEHSYQIQQFSRPVYQERQRSFHPITVQAPVTLPPIASAIPLTGLKANIDRVIIPCPQFPRQYSGKYNSIYKECPQLLRERERTCSDQNSCCACAPGPVIETLYENNDPFHQHRDRSCGSHNGYTCSSCCGGHPLQAFYGHRYEYGAPQFPITPKTTDGAQPRTKRQLPFLNHGYKFMVNMLPPFIQEPIKHSVNIMAMTHPDKKLKKLYYQPPKQTLHEKLTDQHKKNVAMLKEKLYGPTTAPPKKNHHHRKSFGDDLMRREASHFLNSLHEPVDKARYAWSPKISTRTVDDDTRQWLKEMRTNDISEDDGDDQLSESKKALLLLKLKKLNAGRSRRDITEVQRNKRSVVIDSEEFELPLYQIRLKDSNEVGGDSEEYEDDYSREAIVGRSRNDDYEDSREEMLRRAIKAELRKFKKEESEEVVASPFQYDKMIPHSPIFHLLTLPMKLLGGLNGMHQQSLVGSVPKMIIGTKKYFRDFGKNFKKNALHFASDIVGDFDHHGPTDHILAPLIGRRRHKRSLGGNYLQKNLEQYEPEYTLDYTTDRGQNFHDGTESKVRKKRYIVRMVDDDEVEEIVRAKLGKMFEDHEHSYRPRRKSHKKRKYSEEDYSNERPTKTYQRRRKYDSCESDEDEDFRKKVVIEKLRPKIIIDNNGLPFMELNGFKRPLFMKSKGERRKKSSSAEDHTNINYGSSEEADMKKIHDLIYDTQNDGEILQSTHNEMPMQTLKEKLSLLLFETDVLVHMNFEKYDEIYDDMIELQYIKTSIVQDWKRLVMQKKINDKDCKVALLGKFKEMQRIKEITMTNIVNALYIDSENRFIVKELTKMLVKLQKFQCIINQVVACFQEHFQMGTKFDMAKEIKFVDFLSSINFVKAKTRNDLIAVLKEDRDCQLQENIHLLDKLKKLLVDECEDAIQEEAHILWEMKNIERMQKANIEEMYQRTDCGQKIRKNLKILFDLSKRLRILEEKEKNFHNTKKVSSESEEEIEVSIEDKKSIKIKHPVKKFDIEDFKKKWQDKIDKHKMLFQKSMKKNMMKLKKSGSTESGE